jgi:hypothetical protein
MKINPHTMPQYIQSEKKTHTKQKQALHPSAFTLGRPVIDKPVMLGSKLEINP